MKPKDIFGIIVRVIGLVLLIYAIWFLIYGFATIMGYSEVNVGYKVSYFISGTTFLLLSLYLLRGAPLLVKYSYPEKANKEKESE